MVGQEVQMQTGSHRRGEATSELQEIWDVELGLLREFKRICDEHGLTYYLWAGSMLGAVRHEGIIPWDDDIDVAMPREDFEKFFLIAPAELPEYAFLQSDHERKLFMGGKMRLRDSRTTGFEYYEAKYGSNLGIWIDILALDYVYADIDKRHRQITEISRCVEVCKTEGKERGTVSEGALKQFSDAATMCPKEEAGYVRPFTAAFSEHSCALFDLSFFRHQMLVKYQDLLMPIPSKYDTILRMQYDDYTRLLPFDQRKPSHQGVFNPQTPYTVYQKRIQSVFEVKPGEKTVLFGVGDMFQSYMEKYGGRRRPNLIVDNDPARWNLEFAGIPIVSPERLREFSSDQLHIVICSSSYAPIAEQLEGMGLHDYSLFVEPLDTDSQALFPKYKADGSFECEFDDIAQDIDFFGYGVGKRIDAATGRVVHAGDEYMTSDKVWHAWPGSKLILKNRQYHYAVATYSKDVDGTLIYTYCYAPDMNWTSYNHDLTERGFIGRDYIFQDERYFRVMLKRLDGGEIPREAETEGILEYVERVPKDVTRPKEYFLDEINKTVGSVFESRRECADPLSLLLVSDTYYAPGTTWDESLKNIRSVTESAPIDSIIHLGDLTDGLGGKLLTKDYSDHVMNGLRQTDLPVYLTIGNHDTNYFHGNPDVYSLPEQFDAFHSGKDPKDVCRRGADLWYFVDRPAQRLRMIFLGSYDAARVDRYGFWDEEVEWVGETLSQMRDGWRAIVFSHLPLLPEMHYWSKDIRNYKRLLDILAPYGAEGRVLAYIHGHSHCDQIETKYGFPIVSIGCNKIESFADYKPEGSVTYDRKLGTSSEDLWDVLTIDADSNVLRFARFGAGEDRVVQGSDVAFIPEKD